MAKDISMINWKKIKDSGFNYLVFDKENTLTKPGYP